MPTFLKRQVLTIPSCTYIELSPSTLVVSYTKEAVDGVLLVGIASKQVIKLPLSLNTIHKSALRKVSESKFTIIGSDSTSSTALYLLDIGHHKVTLLRSSTSMTLGMHSPWSSQLLYSGINWTSIILTSIVSLQINRFSPRRSTLHFPGMLHGQIPLSLSKNS